MLPVHTPLTVPQALLSDPQRPVLDGAQLRQLAACFPSTAELAAAPWDAAAVTQRATDLWAAMCDAIDPVFSQVAEEDFEPSLPIAMQELSTLRFLLWLWRPGDVRPASGRFDLGNALLCHWDAAHRQAFLTWAQTGLAGPTRPSEIFQSGDRVAHPHAAWPETAGEQP